MDVLTEFQQRWLLRPRPLEKPALRLIALPYAGGNGTVYYSWQAGLDDGIELNAIMMPGRLSRIDEPVCTSLTELTDVLIDVIHTLSDVPCVFFGHSMGAIMAWYLTHQLGQRGLAMPRHLFLSGHGAPGASRNRSVLQTLSDDEFVLCLKRYNGIQDMITREPALMRLVLPALRADFQLLDQLPDANYPPLNVPFSVLSGSHDPNVSAVSVERWPAFTRAPCSVHYFPGDHFFIQPQRDAVLALINQTCCALRECSPA